MPKMRKTTVRAPPTTRPSRIDPPRRVQRLLAASKFRTSVTPPSVRVLSSPNRTSVTGSFNVASPPTKVETSGSTYNLEKIESVTTGSVFAMKAAYASTSRHSVTGCAPQSPENLTMAAMRTPENKVPNTAKITPVPNWAKKFRRCMWKAPSNIEMGMSMSYMILLPAAEKMLLAASPNETPP